MRIRRKANKARSTRRFTKRRNKTHLVNLSNPPMRGGIRL